MSCSDLTLCGSRHRSKHPYTSNCDERLAVKLDDAPFGLELSFDSLSQTENGYDRVRVFRDAECTDQVADTTWSGKDFPGTKGRPPYVLPDASSCWIQLTR